MSKKYHITEAQMKRIVSQISKDNKPEIIEEGFKEVALGAAMLLGVTFGGNQAMAQKANDAVNKTEVLTQIKSTLEDEEGKAELAKFLKMTPEQLDSYLTKNADKVESDFELAARKKNMKLSLRLKDVKNQKSTITSKLKYGYAVSDIVVHMDTIVEPGDVVYAQRTVDIDFSSGDMFVSGSYKLKPEVIDSITQTIESVKSMNGKIVRVNIESSTDKEPIKIGNEQLANNRANSVVEVLKSLGVDSKTNINTLPDQGPDVYTKTMTQQEREQVRKETAEYRYVNISFVVVIAEPVEVSEPLYKVNERIEVELVKTNVYKPSKGKKFKSYRGDKSKHKKNKCLKVKKKKGSVLDCSFQD
tara:strand:- start:3444 stop:4520 length:1077 start_codon:yes stop_codon:yes gene_type:complete